MQKTNTGLKVAACLAVSAVFGATASAQQVIYNNSSTWLGQRTGEGNAEIGDAVVFDPGARTLSRVEFEFFVTPGASGNETGQFFMYALDGANGIPGTLLFSSPTFNLVPATSSGFGTVDISNLAENLPDRIAWTVAISGLEGNEQAGLLFYNPPSNGSSPTFDPGNGTGQHDYFLRHNVNGWQLLDTPNLVDNLNVRFTAVPEPGTIALLLGGLVTMGALRRRKS